MEKHTIFMNWNIQHRKGVISSPIYLYRKSPTTLSQDEKNTDVTQECKIARCTENQIEMRPISIALAP